MEDKKHRNANMFADDYEELYTRYQKAAAESAYYLLLLNRCCDQCWSQLSNNCPLECIFYEVRWGNKLFSDVKIGEP